jgi:hypothetical protein
LAELGRFTEAARVQAKLIAELEHSKREDLARLERTNLKLYESGQPCRQPWRDDDPIFSPRPGNMEVVIPNPA